MRTRRAAGLKRWAVLLGLGAVVGCASPPVRRTAAVAKGPASPKHCDFEFYEMQAPTRPYEVIGEVPLTTNEWMNMGDRKELLRKTACAADVDAVLLGQPVERTMLSGKRLREYRARLLVFLDKPRAGAVPPPPPLEEPPLPPGTIPVPVMLNGLKEELTGTETREVVVPEQ